MRNGFCALIGGHDFHGLDPGVAREVAEHGHLLSHDPDPIAASQLVQPGVSVERLG